MYASDVAADADVTLVTASRLLLLLLLVLQRATESFIDGGTRPAGAAALRLAAGRDYRLPSRGAATTGRETSVRSSGHSPGDRNETDRRAAGGWVGPDDSGLICRRELTGTAIRRLRGAGRADTKLSCSGGIADFDCGRGQTRRRDAGVSCRVAVVTVI